MFIGGIPKVVAQQIATALDGSTATDVYVCCSGSFRTERTIWQQLPGARVHGNDVSLYSSAIGEWLAGGALDCEFTDALAPLEKAINAGVGASARRRAAGAVYAAELARFATGKMNAFKEAHVAHLMNGAEAALDAIEEKLETACAGGRLASFHRRDWLAHLRDGVANGATVVAFPPTYRGGYEKTYAWIEANARWTPPTYETWDPKNLDGVVRELAAGGADYCILADRKLEGVEPDTMFQALGKRVIYGYTHKGRPQWAKAASTGKPFNYKPLDTSKITKDSVVEVTPIDGPRALYIRTVYIKNTIAPAPALQNYFIFIDGMLAGVLGYSVNKMPGAVGKNKEHLISCYLMCDVSLSREGRISKLIARLALNRDVVGHFGRRMLQPYKYIVTTAFSDHPASMKYRGIWELLSRKEVEPPGRGFNLQYGGHVINETPAEAFGWWWSKHSDKAQGK
jgi:hypothetical protein